MQPIESNSRSIIKAFSYRILGSASTGFITFAFTGKASLSVGVGAMDMVVKIALYYLHERIWARIPMGRTKRPEYEI